jgi:hypothetical protein
VARIIGPVAKTCQNTAKRARWRKFLFGILVDNPAALYRFD